MFRVWIRDFDGNHTVQSDWLTRQECEQFIYAKWNSWPGDVFISGAKDKANFVRYNQLET